MKHSIKTWLIATVSTSLGIALGMLLSPKKHKCASKGDSKNISNNALRE